MQNEANKTKDLLWDLLGQKNLLNGTAPEEHYNESPWFVKILLGFSGWLAALFLLGFLGATFSFIFEKPLGSFIGGALLLTASYFQLTHVKNDFAENLAFACSLAGQALIFYSIFEIFSDTARLTMLVIIAVEIALFILIPHFIHRLFTVATAVATLLIFASTYHLDYLASGILLIAFIYFALHEFKFPKRQEMLQAGIYGCVLVLIFFYISLRYNLSDEFFLNDLNNPELFTKISYWGGLSLLFFAALFCVIQLLQRYEIILGSKESMILIVSALVFCVVGIQAHGVILSTVILLCGFANSNRILQGLGIVSLLFFISQYYYSLNITLLEKSQHLLVLGISLLLVRWLAATLLKAKTQNKGVSSNV